MKVTRQQKRKAERDAAKLPAQSVQKLEACMIIKNEEEMLPRALDSLKGIDKITILDTGSSDRTMDIYKEYQDKGYDLDWYEYSQFDEAEYSLKSFSHARNECKGKCYTGDWLFILDGDEYCDFDIKKVQNMINSRWIHKYDVLSLTAILPVERTTQPRVFRNSPKYWYYQSYHNTLRFWPEGLKGQSEPVHKEKSYQTSLEIIALPSPNHEREPDRTLKILEHALKVNPLDNRAMYYIAREWLQRQEPLKALYYLSTYAEISPPVTNEYAEVCFLIATIYSHLEIWPKVAEWAFKCVAILPGFKQAWMLIHAISHEEFKHYWLPMIKGADNKGVMFIRDVPYNKEQFKFKDQKKINSQ